MTPTAERSADKVLYVNMGGHSIWAAPNEITGAIDSQVQRLKANPTSDAFTSEIEEIMRT